MKNLLIVLCLISSVAHASGGDMGGGGSANVLKEKKKDLMSLRHEILIERVMHKYNK